MNDWTWLMLELVKIAKEQKYPLLHLAQACSLGPNALYHWSWGVVEDARLSTVSKVARELGYELELVKLETEDAA
jgi:hypothetical protein